jgi:hypothetical protein
MISRAEEQGEASKQWTIEGGGARSGGAGGGVLCQLAHAKVEVVWTCGVLWAMTTVRALAWGQRHDPKEP